MTQRIALVTGGTGGIGTAICQRLAKLGTPTIIASDGSVLGGYLEPAQLAQRLASVQEVPSRP